MRLNIKILRHHIFQIGILLKGIDGILEIIGGLFVLFVSPAAMSGLVRLLIRHELGEDPTDIIAHALMKAASQISVNVQWFAFLYLFSHGVIKIFLAVSLLKRKLWSYPVAIGFFALFIIYQLYRYMLDYSIWWMALTALDLFIIVLTWLEYRELSRNLYE